MALATVWPKLAGGRSAEVAGVAISSTVGPISSAMSWSLSRSKPYTARGVGRRHLPDLLFGKAGEEQTQCEPRVRVAALVVRVIGSPHEAIHADLVTDVDIRGDHQRDTDVAVAPEVLRR